jgi:hypothetical protein
MSSIMSRLPYISRILFLCIAKYVRIASDTCCCFSTWGQPWLASIWSSRRGRPKTAMSGSLLPRAAPLLPRARTWEAPVIAEPLLLPRARRRLHRMTRWRCGWSTTPLLLLYTWWLLLWHAFTRFHPTTPPQTPRATTTNVPRSKRWTHMNCF